MKIRFLKPGFYKHNYPMGAVVEVDENFGKYAVGLKDAEEAGHEEPITDPIPYTMKARSTPTEDALVIIANDIQARRFAEAAARQNERSET